MEFEKNAPVSDAQRRLAESKKITLQPLHGNITPEDSTDSVITARHLNDQPIGNTENDTEQNVPPIQPAHSFTDYHASNSKAKKQPLNSVHIALIAIGVIIIASLYIILR